MKLDDVRGLKAEISAEVVAQAGGAPDVVAFHATTERPMPVGVSLGVSLAENGQHLLAIRSPSAQAAERFVQLAKGEADVRIVQISKRPGPAYFQAVRRPLEPGAEVAMAGKDFLGTLGCFVRDAQGRLHVLSNSHVLADEGTASPGHLIHQPFGGQPIATLTRFIPFSNSAPNLVDAAIARLNPAIEAVLAFTGAINGSIGQAREMGPDLLGATVAKAGRTTGSRIGKITAVELDGVTVSYDRGMFRFNDQVEISGGPGKDFSAGGDSGSLIVTMGGAPIALLFAGGPSAQGDLTYGNPLGRVLESLGVTLAF